MKDSQSANHPEGYQKGGKMSSKKKQDPREKLKFTKGEMVPAFSEPEHALVPISDHRIQTIVEVWLREVSPSSAKVYTTIVRNFFAAMHLARDIGVVERQVPKREGEGMPDSIQVFDDWDRVMRADVINEMSAVEVKAYLNHRQSAGLPFVRFGYLIEGKPIGRKRLLLELSVLKSLAQELFIQGILPADEAARISILKYRRHGTPPPQKAVTPDQYQAVLDFIKPRSKKDLLRAMRDRCVIILAFRYYLRKQELIDLKVGNLQKELVKDNGEYGTIWVLEWKSKGDKVLRKRLRPEVAEPILIWLTYSGLKDGDPDNPMFPSMLKSGKFRRDPKNPHLFRKNSGLDGVVEKCFDDAWVHYGMIEPGERSGITLHALRRGGSQAAYLGQKAAGGLADIRQISKDMGHASISTTDEYLGKIGYGVGHSSEFIAVDEGKTADWLVQEVSRLKTEDEEGGEDQ